jgi:putative Holliday junction resolvase
MTRVMSVDPGDVRIGVAISDPTALIARPLAVLDHISLQQDVSRLLELADEYDVSLIIVGLPLDSEGEIGPQARKSMRIIEALDSHTDRAVKAWDESGSTKRAAKLQAGEDLLDAHAAAVILQDYLDVQIK